MHFEQSPRPSLWLQDDLDAAVFFVSELLVRFRGVVQGFDVSDHERWIDLAIGDLFHQRCEVTLHVSLAQTNLQCFVHRGSPLQVHAAEVNTRHGHSAAFAAALEDLVQHVRPI